jgi:TonB family protein
MNSLPIPLLALFLSLGLGAIAVPLATSPRVRDARVPALPVQAYGGGEVAVELTVGASGDVTAVETLRATAPYTDAVVRATSTWRFAAATATIDGRRTAVTAPVLVVAIFRPPTIYAGPAPGGLPEARAVPSSKLPPLPSLVVPAYPPGTIGDGVVIVEIEMTKFGASRGYRIVTPQSGFDSAALDAVRAWRFAAPRDSEVADQLFVYAVLGFRAPVAY